MVEPDGYKVLQEGKAKILYKEERLEQDDKGMIKPKGKSAKKVNEMNEVRGAVFYNPVQEFNRDTSILAITEYAKILKEEKEAK
jgi:tRNA G26 N,N-dimethylase Trm1